MAISLIFSKQKHLLHQVESIRGKLYRVAYSWCSDAMLADDLVQDSITRAIKSLSQLKDEQALQAWMFTILNNQWREYLRRNRPTLDIDDMVLESDSTPEQTLQQQETVTQVRDAIAELPLGQRQTITLVDLEDMSYQEVSEILDVPIGTVMSRLNRARKALLQKLQYQEKAMSITYLRSVK